MFAKMESKYDVISQVPGNDVIFSFYSMRYAKLVMAMKLCTKCDSFVKWLRKRGKLVRNAGKKYWEGWPWSYSVGTFEFVHGGQSDIQISAENFSYCSELYTAVQSSKIQSEHDHILLSIDRKFINENDKIAYIWMREGQKSVPDSLRLCMAVYAEGMYAKESMLSYN